jgi:hypothetical protein
LRRSKGKSPDDLEEDLGGWPPSHDLIGPSSPSEQVFPFDQLLHWNEEINHRLSPDTFLLGLELYLDADVMLQIFVQNGMPSVDDLKPSKTCLVAIL